MAPFAFQGALAARDLGLLAAVRTPATADQLVHATGLPATSVAVLLEACLACELVAEVAPASWTLTTVGTVWLGDPQVVRDADFTHTVCWHGLADLPAALRAAAPVGLRRFGPWPTIYAGLTQLAPEVRRAWSAYDHGHSDSAFPAAIAQLRRTAPATVLDVGGNTGRFAVALLGADPQVRVTILDHPGQVSEAQANLAAAGHAARATAVGLDLGDPGQAFPTAQDAVWMSQFLDCFAPAEVVDLLSRARAALAPAGSVWVLEVCPDRQRVPAAAASLRLASLYFTALANGVSRFYRGSELIAWAAAAGLQMTEAHDGLGSAHTLFRFQAER
jgi:hypothetical protein